MPQIAQQVLKLQFKPTSFTSPHVLHHLLCYLNLNKKSQKWNIKSFHDSLRKSVFAAKQWANLQQEFLPPGAVACHFFFCCVCFNDTNLLSAAQSSQAPSVSGSLLILWFLYLFRTLCSDFILCYFLYKVFPDRPVSFKLSYFFVYTHQIYLLNGWTNEWKRFMLWMQK